MTNVFAIRKMLTNREKEYGKNETFWDFSLYFNFKLGRYRSMKCAYLVYILVYLQPIMYEKHFVAQLF